MVVKPIINLATKYTDDIIGFGVRNWAKPTNFKGLKIASSSTDNTVFAFTNNSNNLIKKLVHNVDEVYVSKPKINGTNVEAITSESEFIDVLTKLKSHRTWNKAWNVPNANHYETALMPYAGKADIHEEINQILRFGKLSEVNYFLKKDILDDYIRITDYALKGIDKTYGKYSGVVYRYGLMDAKLGKQTLSFVSTASNPNGAARVAKALDTYNEPYNIIFTKHGHKIVDVQKKLAYCDDYIKESEILLEPGRKYEQIKEITPEMERLRKQLYSIIETEQGINPEGLLKVDFYREVL